MASFDFNTEKAIKIAKEAKKEIKRRILTYSMAGFGLVIGLAWNDAIRSLIDYLIPQAGSGIIAKFVYALVLTLVVGLTLFYLEKSSASDEGE